MWKLLQYKMPGSHSPLGAAMKLRGLSAPPRLLLGFSGVAPSQAPSLSWSKCGREYTRRSVAFARPGWLCWAFTVLGLGSLPLQVWAVPPGLGTALAGVDAFLEMRPDLWPAGRTDATHSDHEALFADSAFQPQPVRLPPLPGTACSLLDPPHIGVTVFAPFTQPKCYALPLGPGTGLSTLCASVLCQEQLRGPGYHCIWPVYPQRHEGYAAFVLSAPEHDRLGLASVIVDLSRVGGHYCAELVPKALVVEDFLCSVLQQTWADDRTLCLRRPHGGWAVSSGQILQVDHGDVLTVLWEGERPHTPISLYSLFENPVSRGLCQHMPIRLRSPGVLLLVRQDIIALPAHHLPGRDLNRIVGAVLGSNAPPFQLYVNELLPDVEYQGEPCNVVVYVQESTDTQGEAALEGPRPIFPRLQTFPILCDARQVGRGLSVMPAADVLVTDHDVLAFLGLPGAGSPFRVRHLPHDQHPALESSLRCVQVFEEQGVFASPGTHWRAASGPTLPQLLYQDAGHQDPGPPGADTDGGASPGGLSCASSPAEADVDDHSGNLTDTESEAAVFEAAFLVFRIGYTPLLVQLSLSVHVTVADAIDAVRTALDSHVRAAFPLLLPVLPQLSDAWGSVLALLSWAIDESVVVLDMRQYDGRFFPAALPPVFNQGHVCRAARLPEDGSFQVFPFGADLPLLGADEVEVRPGGSVTIVPTGRRPSNRGYLPAMLADPQGWTPAHMLPSGPGGLRSHYVCLVFETGCRLHFLDSPPGTHVAAIALCYGLQEHLTTAQATSPRVLDVSLEGYACRGVAAVSGDLTSIPVPPGRLRTGVFSYCR